MTKGKGACSHPRLRSQEHAGRTGGQGRGLGSGTAPERCASAHLASCRMARQRGWTLWGPVPRRSTWLGFGVQGFGLGLAATLPVYRRLRLVSLMHVGMRSCATACRP